MKKWNELENGFVYEGVRVGMSVREIIKRMGTMNCERTWSAVAGKVARVKKELGMKLRVVNRWKAEEWQKALQLWVEGKAMTEIQKTVRPGCTYSSVYDKFYFKFDDRAKYRQIAKSERAEYVKARFK